MQEKRSGKDNFRSEYSADAVCRLDDGAALNGSGGDIMGVHDPAGAEKTHSVIGRIQVVIDHAAAGAGVDKLVVSGVNAHMGGGVCFPRIPEEDQIANLHILPGENAGRRTEGAPQLH